MKKFIYKLIVFIFTGFILLNLISLLILESKYFYKSLSTKVQLSAIKKSKKKISSKVIILGDSVARQIFPVTMENSLAVNGAILTAGHYILARNAIEKNPGIKYVVIISAPFILAHKFERLLTYNNFVKPFYSFDKLKYFSNLLKKKINKKPLSNLALFPVFKISPIPQFNFKESSRKNLNTCFSDISIEYTKKLYNLLKRKGIELIIVSPPLSKDTKRTFGNWNSFKTQISEFRLNYIYKNYLNSIIYYDSDYFIDSIHIKRRFLRNNREKIMKSILPERVIIQLEKDKILPIIKK